MDNKYLLEIGVEELPAKFIDEALEQLYDNIKKMFEEERIEYKDIKTYVTPRRLVAIVEGLEDKQSTLTETVKGPAKKIAYDEEGKPSKALEGFMRGQK